MTKMTMSRRSRRIRRSFADPIRTFDALALACTAAFVLVIAVPARADLIDRGGGLIYDTELDVTWLQDARYASTSGFDGDGRMTWPLAMSWAAELIYYDSVRDRSWSDWRLPSAKDFDSLGVPLCFGFDCPKSEIGHLYFAHGVTADSPTPFINIIKAEYWYEDTRAPLPGLAWIFQFRTGKQDRTGPFEELNLGYVWAVRDGDVWNPPVGVPVGGIAFWTLACLLGMAVGTRAIVKQFSPGAGGLRGRKAIARFRTST
jgi:hypothetical protein